MIMKKITHQEFEDALKIVNDYKNQLEDHYKEVVEKQKTIPSFAGINSMTEIRDIKDLDVRTINCLIIADVFIVKDLERYSIRDIKRFRRAGKKTIETIKEICFYANIELKP